MPSTMPLYGATWLRILSITTVCAATLNAQSLVDEVDPFIGTSYAAHNLPGAVVPWGMVSLSPHTELADPSGYYLHNPNRLHGFGHVHLSGVGCHDLANIVLMPTLGDVETDHESFSSIIRNETASPGYYRCDIERYGVAAELTATERAGLSRYVFASSTSKANVMIDVTQGVTKSLGAHVRIVSATEVEGYNVSGRFCSSPTHQRVHFVARLSRPAIEMRTWARHRLSDARAADGESIGAALRFSVAAGDTILVKVGISYTSIENARRNLDTEIPHWDFEAVHDSARVRWEQELGRIRVTGGTSEQRTIFYTALYHTMFHPNLFHDVSGDYRMMGDRGIGRVDGYDRYTVYSLWDTYRTLHPLMAMVWPQRQNDMTRTMIEKYRENGWLPKWSLMGMDAYSMSGDPATIVIADTWAKGIRDYDLSTAFSGMLRSATEDVEDNFIRPGIQAYMRHGHIPPDDRTGHWYIYGPTSTSLEYHVADWALSRVAMELCRPDDYATFVDRSCGYRRVWDTATMFFRPRDADGDWSSPWDPSEYSHEDKYYTEGDAYNYRYFLPHDMPSLITMHGGDTAFTASLQSYFDQKRFMWNEHNIAYPYLFTFVDGQSWRTHDAVRTLMKNFTATPSSVRTNEDAGTISAWYVLSAIGVFPVVYGTDEYQIGSPIFDSVTITPARPGARPFTITAAGTSDRVRYIAAADLNGRPLDRPQLRASEVAAGGRLTFTMSARPTAWGTVHRAPDSMSARSHVRSGSTAIDFTWAASHIASTVRLQVSADPTFCTTYHDTVLASAVTDITLHVTPSEREVWWRLASVDAHGVHAWSVPTLHEVLPPRLAAIDEHALWLEHTDGRSALAHFRLPDDGPGMLTIYDRLGRAVTRTSIIGCADVGTKTLDLGALSRGVYFVRLSTERGGVTVPHVIR